EKNTLPLTMTMVDTSPSETMSPSKSGPLIVLSVSRTASLVTDMAAALSVCLDRSQIDHFPDETKSCRNKPAPQPPCAREEFARLSGDDRQARIFPRTRPRPPFRQGGGRAGHRPADAVGRDQAARGYSGRDAGQARLALPGADA